jgi:hypothetical protein
VPPVQTQPSEGLGGRLPTCVVFQLATSSRRRASTGPAAAGRPCS